jgi:hypothetical protein
MATAAGRPNKGKLNEGAAAGSAQSASGTSNAMELALATLQPIRDLSRNWDVDIASWYELLVQFALRNRSVGFLVPLLTLFRRLLFRNKS